MLTGKSSRTALLFREHVCLKFTRILSLNDMTKDTTDATEPRSASKRNAKIAAYNPLTPVVIHSGENADKCASSPEPNFERSNENSILKSCLFSIEDLDTFRNGDEPPPSWSALLMYGIDDPNRMSFTQSLAFPPATEIATTTNKKYTDGHVAAERRLNNYAKIITLVVFALVASFLFGFLYKMLR